MMLRLGLVGIVAALGVTLPAQPACERWFDSVQSWASATLADWDTWKPGDDRSDYSRYARGKTDCLQCRLAQAKLAAKPQDPVTTAAHEAVAKVSQDGADLRETSGRQAGRVNVPGRGSSIGQVCTDRSARGSPRPKLHLS